ncbi:MAG TPA: hypothetical protein VHL58_13890 [Thermoanaerobaculia bacterium]|nr:hypothetical protein [Thermoanaerobaculia bacterium]
MREVYEQFRKTLIRLGRPELLAAVDQEETHRGTPDTVQALLTSAGLLIEKTVERPLALRFADGSAMFRHGLVRFFLDGGRSIVKEIDEIEFFGIVERNLNELATQRGGLSFEIPMIYVQARKE